MSKERPDFITVRLSEAGKRLAGTGGVVRWANSRRHFEFKVDQAVELERSYEWNHLLSKETFQGKPILEEAPDDAIEQTPAADPDEEAN